MTVQAEPTRLLDADGLEAGYANRAVLRDFDLHLGKGEILLILGHNGAGKTTLLRAIFGLLRPSRGTIRYASTDITGEPPRRNVERGIAFVPQGHGIFPRLSVRENLELGAFTVADRTQLPVRLTGIHELFPVLAERGRQAAGLLSGGQQQMLALARGLVARPRVLLLDEPSLGLSPLLVRQIFDAIGRLRTEGFTILLVEQLAGQALALADRAYVLERGRITLEGTAAAVREDPAVIHAYLGRGGLHPGS